MGSVVPPLPGYSQYGPFAPYADSDTNTIPGFFAARVSRVMPQRFKICGVKLSITISNCGTSFQKISRPLSVPISKVIALLFRFAELYRPCVLRKC